MISVIDRSPQAPNRKRVTREDTGESYFATVEFADDPTRQGTPISRNLFLALQVSHDNVDQRASFLKSHCEG